MTMAKGGKPKPRATGTVTLTSPAPVDKDSPLTFDWSISGLSGQEYALIYVRVESEDGDILYGRLDKPEPLTPWVIGAGSCPWLDPNNPHYGQNGIGQIQLWVYVPFRQQDATSNYMVAATPEFVVTW